VKKLSLPRELGAVREIAMDTARAVLSAFRPKAQAAGPGFMPGFEFLTYGSVLAGEGGGVGSPYEALQCAPVFAAVKVLSESFAQIPCHLHERDEKGSLGRELDHPVAELLADAPNPEMTAFEFRQYTMEMIALFGNGFAWIVRDGEGYPAELWPLRPEQVAVVYDPAFPLKPLYTVTGPDGQAHTLHRQDVFHVRTLGALPYRGDSPVLLNRRTIANWIAMEAHLVRLFARGAKPSGVLKTQKVLSPEAIIQLRKQMDGTHGGAGSAQTLVLEEGMEWQQTSLSSVDSQFSELRKEQLQTVARIFRIPPLLLQDPEKAIGSTAETFGRWFISFTLAPLLEAWEQACALSFLTRNERINRYYLQHDTSEFTRAESQTRFQAYVAGLTNGVFNVNEVRSMENMAPIEGGDVYRVPVNTAPATQQYHGQNSHVIDPNPTLMPALPKNGRARAPAPASRAIEAPARAPLLLPPPDRRSSSSFGALAAYVDRDPQRLRLVKPPKIVSSRPQQTGATEPQKEG
jgi:HK97 family phage portal protein